MPAGDPWEDDDPPTQLSTVRGKRYRGPAERLMHGEEPRIEPGEVLGRGGMGVVRSAVQTTLGREVAIKAPLDPSDDDIGAILQEAWVTGALEHPNVVPVYDIEVLDGVPNVVMKKLVGIEWAKVVNKPQRIWERFGRRDHLTWNLEVLIAVCNAAELAHSRGILHRDLKPANVMLGHFGEVWVVDWGIAVSLTEEHAERLPLAREQTTVAGTPAYMAPEMARGEADRLDERSDVYLLGAILYRIVSGSPPRRTNDLAVALERAHEPIAIDRRWPLADLMASSLSIDPQARPRDVAAFRSQVQAFLREQGPRRMLRSAQRELAKLEQAVNEPVPDDDPELQRVTVHDLFSACRFGFSEALDGLGERPEILEGLRDAALLVARYELEQGDDRAAQLALVDLERVPDDLQRAIDALATRRSQARERLEVLEADVDPRTAAWSRLLVCAVIGGVWALTPVATVLAGFDRGYARELGISGVTFVLTLLVVTVLSPWIVRSRLNRVVVSMVTIAPALAFVLNLGGWLRGIDSEITGTIELLTYFIPALLVSMVGDWRLIFGTMSYLLAFFLAMASPGTTLFWMNVANVLMVLNTLVVWVPHLWWTGDEPTDRPLF